MIEGKAVCKGGFIVESLTKDFVLSIPPKRKVKFRKHLGNVSIVQKDFVWRTDEKQFEMLFDVVEAEENE